VDVVDRSTGADRRHRASAQTDDFALGVAVVIVAPNQAVVRAVDEARGLDPRTFALLLGEPAVFGRLLALGLENWGLARVFRR